VTLVAAVGALPLILVNASLWGGTESVFYSSSLGVQALTALGLASSSLLLVAAAWALGWDRLRWHWALWLPVAYLAWATVSTFTSVSPQTAILGQWGRYEGLLAHYTFGVLLFLVAQLADTQARLRILFRVMIVAGGIVSTYGLIQAAGLDPLVWGTSDGVGRSFATLGNPDMFGGFAVLVLFVSLGNALSEKDIRWRVGSYVAATLAVSGAYTSYSRAAWIAVIAGAALGGFAVWRIRPKLSRLDSVLFAALAAVVVLVVAVSAVVPQSGSDTVLARRVRSTVNSADRNTSSRIELWRMALNSIADRPIVGSGPDTFGLVSKSYLSLRLAEQVAPEVIQGTPHNVLLQQGSDLGVIGVVLWLCALLGVAIVSTRWILGEAAPVSLRMLLAGAWVACAAFVVDSLFGPSHVVNSAYLWCLLGALLSPLATGVDLDSAARRSGLAAFAALLALSGIVSAATFLVADHYAALAVRSTYAPVERTAAALRAVVLNPLSAAYSNLAFEAQSDRLSELLDSQPRDASAIGKEYSAAVDSAKRTAAIEPTDPRRISALASIILLGADSVDSSLYPQAVTEARRAESVTSPYDLQTKYWLARALFHSGDKETARVKLEEALRIRPDYTQATILLADVDFSSGRKDEARKLLTDALPGANQTDRVEIEQMLQAIR
jgi:O-antigen ligase